MPQYKFKGKNNFGKEMTAVFDAPNLKVATDRLKFQKFTNIEIAEYVPNAIELFIKKINPLKPSVSSKELVIFSRQLSTLVSAGVPIIQGLLLMVVGDGNAHCRGKGSA